MNFMLVKKVIHAIWGIYLFLYISAILNLKCFNWYHRSSFDPFATFLL